MQGYEYIQVYSFARVNTKNSAYNRKKQEKAPEKGAFLAQRMGFEPMVRL